ncbi:Smr/MutS family protein [Maricaulis sp.]|uniref:Smr/MutS family protein n=1 Tax=Maricaulis sp. TaxID=1486257 RepID=UPI002602AFA5|nr:Smr/MutS family protein [Maricaulis sp.]
MGRKRDLQPEEKAIWRKVARSVTPLDAAKARSLNDEPVESARENKAVAKKKPAKPAAAKPKSKPKPKKHRASVDVHHQPRHHQAPVPVDRSTEKRVRRGKLDIDARLDLHGLTQEQALSTLTHFLAMAWKDGYRNVLVITGKGAMSRTKERDHEPWEFPDEPGVLRRKLPEWLGKPNLRQYVSGYSSAHTRHGGAGAFYVTLRVK